MDYILRPLREGEYPLLPHFVYESLYVPEGEQPFPVEIMEEPELKLYSEAFGTRPADVCFVADVRGELVGAAWARIMDDYGHIDNDTPSIGLTVEKDHRQRGIASALMRMLLRNLREHGYAYASLSSQKENTAAVRLYNKLGFDVYEDKGEEYIMRINLRDVLRFPTQGEESISL